MAIASRAEVLDQLLMSNSSQSVDIHLLSCAIESRQQSKVEYRSIEKNPTEQYPHALPLAHAIDRELSEDLFIIFSWSRGIMLETVDQF